MRQDLKILYVVTHCPYGQTYGAQLRTLQIGRLLQRLGKVTLVIAPFEELDPNDVNRTKQDFDLGFVARVERKPVRGFLQQLRLDIDPRYLNTHDGVVIQEDVARVQELARSHDVTWIHTLRSANYFNIFKWERSVLDIDDFYSHFHFTAASRAPTLRRRLSLTRRALQWKRRECDLLNRFDLITVCSDDDAARIPKQDRVQVIPNGFDDPPPVPRDKESLRLGFIGRLHYLPNRNGVQWFLDEVWPMIKSTVPEAEFRVVGKGGDEAWNKISGVHVLGYVDDTATEIASWAGMVVPFLIGGGTAVKVAEAFARSCPVVSTTVGAFGYDVRHDRELLIADTPDDFAEGCVRLLTSEEDRHRLAAAARAFFASNLNWDALAPRVEAAIQRVLARYPKRAQP